MSIGLESIKVETDYSFGHWGPIKENPFKVNHGEAPAKPIYETILGIWTSFENAKYAAYILRNKNRIQNRPTSMLWGIFKEMSSFVGSRNFRQCKAHHSRLLKVSSSI